MAPHTSTSNQDAPVDTAGSVRIERDRGEQRLVATQLVPCARDEVFPFFADARNLEQLTPPFLRFRILEVSPPEVRRETRVRYRLRLHGMPIGWRTVIEEWEPPVGFTDVQRRGPFRLWRHRHDFVEVNGGTLLRDTVQFAVYGGALLPAVATRWVDRDLREIFNYRQEVIAARFGRLPSASTSAEGPRTSQTMPSVFRSTTT